MFNNDGGSEEIAEIYAEINTLIVIIVAIEEVVEVKLLLLLSLIMLDLIRCRVEVSVKFLEGVTNEPRRLFRAVQTQFVAASLVTAEVLLSDDSHTAVTKLQRLYLIVKSKVMLVFAVLSKESCT